MKVPLSWLKEYVAFDDTPQGLAAKLTFSGTEVEGITTVGHAWTGIVVGEVLRVDPHPNADKLTLCTVQAGGAPLTVVCGTPNVRAGGKYPFAPAGVTLPNGLKLKQARIRGVASAGMLCAEDELGVSEDHSGVMTLDAAWAPGTPLAEVLGPPETVLELEITPNRPDCLSLLGLAREVAALYGLPLRLPETTLAESGRPVAERTRVEVRDPERCPRYTARVLEGVTIGPAPAWMRRRLELAGVRAINNVVDITNYVMLESGQPLHAFDQALLQEGRIVVRRAQPGDVLATLDGVPRPLTPEMLVIADAARPVALAGIMGGAGSEIRDQTTTVLLESACFQPQGIRATSRRLGLATESSYRFERGVDIGGTEWAGRRAAALMTQFAGARAAPGVVDVFPRPPAARRVACRYARVRDVLGLEAEGDRIRAAFTALELPVVASDADGCTVEVPSFRADLADEIDLVEEFARLHGLDRIPAPAPRAAIVPGADDRPARLLEQCRAHLVGLGLREIMNYSLTADALLDRFDPGGAARRIVLPNPISLEQTTLRPSLVPQMVETLGRNMARQVRQAALFELGRVFELDAAGRPAEETRLAVGLLGPVGRTGLDRHAPVTEEDMFLWIKGLWEELAAVLRLPAARLEPAGAPDLEEGRAAAIVLDGRPCGRLGLVREAIRREWRMFEPVAVLELAAAALAAGAAAPYQAVPVYPSVQRDMALIVDETTPHGALAEFFRRVAPRELETVELFDIFMGGTIGAGKKSLAYAFTYRAADRTLTDDEVNRYHDGIKEKTRKEWQVEIREG